MYRVESKIVLDAEDRVNYTGPLASCKPKLIDNRVFSVVTLFVLFNIFYFEHY